MTLPIDELIDNVEDVARQCLFLLTPKSPGGLPGNVSYLVSSSTVPAHTIDPIELNWQGQIAKYGSTHTWDDWTVTFKVDKNAEIHKSFVKWSNKIHHPETGVHGAPSDYMEDQKVEMLDGDGNPISSFNLIKAWPSSVGEITLDYSAKEAATFDVTFAFQYAIPA